MIFIVGYFNCGTTAIAKTLREHPNIRLFSNDAKCEEKIIMQITDGLGLNVQYSPTNKFVDGGYNFNDAIINADIDISIKFREQLNKKIKDCNLIKNNKLFFAKGLLDKSYPTSKRILIIRKGNSYAIAGGHHNMKKKEILDRAKFWNESMKYMSQTWGHDTRTLIIKYENLCLDTQSVLKQLCTFLGIDFNKFNNTLDFKSRNYKFKNINKELKKAIQNETKKTMEAYNKWTY